MTALTHLVVVVLISLNSLLSVATLEGIITIRLKRQQLPSLVVSRRAEINGPSTPTRITLSLCVHRSNSDIAGCERPNLVVTSSRC